MERLFTAQQVLESWSKSCKAIDDVDQEAKDIVREALELKIAEEQGLLPKFHLGDEFWTNWLGKPLKAKIVMLQQKKNGLWKYRFCDEQSHTHDYEENEFGKYFWTTKEETEQALAKMQGN